MLSRVLSSARAIEVNIAIMRIFDRLYQLRNRVKSEQDTHSLRIPVAETFTQNSSHKPGKNIFAP